MQGERQRSNAIGNALTSAGAKIKHAGDALKAISDEIQLEKNRTDLDKAVLDYNTRANELLAGENGLFSKQAKNAIDFGATLPKQFEGLKQSVISTPNLHPKVKKQLELDLSQRELAFNLQAQGYVRQQVQVHEDGISAVHMQEAFDSALANYDSMDAINSSIRALAFQIQADGERKGWTPEIMENRLQTAKSELLMGVIGSYLADGNTLEASQFYRSNKESIDGRFHADIEAKFEQIRKQHIAELRDDIQDAITVLRSGKMMAGLDGLMGAAKGTKYEEPLQEAIEQFQTVREFVRAPLSDQATALRALTLKEEFTPAELSLYESLSKVHSTVINRLSQGDGLALAEELQVIDTPVPLDLNKPETFAARRRQAEIASNHFGIAVSPLSPGETNNLSAQIEAAPADQVAMLLDTLNKGFGDQATVIAGELSKGKHPELGSAMLLAGSGRNEDKQAAIDIVLGARQRAELEGNLELPADQKRPIISDVIGNMFEDVEGEPMNEFIKAADSLYSARRIPSGDLTFDGTVYEQSLRDAMGGVVRFNGRNIIPPVNGMDDSEVREFVRSLTDADLTRFSVSGDLPFAGDQPFSVSLFSRSGPLGAFAAEAQLVSVGPGVYRVIIPGVGFITNGLDGRPYELDLKAAVESKR